MARAKRYVMISVVAERYGIHPQTLRLYEREGLIEPHRSEGNTRLYDEESIARLEAILALTRDMGVNLAGVEVILRLKAHLQELEEENLRLRRALEMERRDRRSGVERQRALVKFESAALLRLEDE